MKISNNLFYIFYTFRATIKSQTKDFNFADISKNINQFNFQVRLPQNMYIQFTRIDKNSIHIKYSFEHHYEAVSVSSETEFFNTLEDIVFNYKNEINYYSDFKLTILRQISILNKIISSLYSVNLTQKSIDIKDIEGLDIETETD